MNIGLDDKIPLKERFYSVVKILMEFYNTKQMNYPSYIPGCPHNVTNKSVSNNIMALSGVISGYFRIKYNIKPGTIWKYDDWCVIDLIKTKDDYFTVIFWTLEEEVDEDEFLKFLQDNWNEEVLKKIKVLEDNKKSLPYLKEIKYILGYTDNYSVI